MNLNNLPLDRRSRKFQVCMEQVLKYQLVRIRTQLDIVYTMLRCLSNNTPWEKKIKLVMNFKATVHWNLEITRFCEMGDRKNLSQTYIQSTALIFACIHHNMRIVKYIVIYVTCNMWIAIYKGL